MDEWPQLHEDMSCSGLTVAVDASLRVATLRYFAHEGAFAEAVHEATGLALPQTLQAVEGPEAQLVLAWRSPTETLVIGAGGAGLSQLAARLARFADGCFVDLSGGLKVVRVSGERGSDLLCRLGGTASVPRPGEARRSRLADVAVLALSVRELETLLVVDRAHLPHVLAWIRETLLDFAAA
jgi:heterotetrameric sarcosine oxidase gamma subunit